MWASKARCGQPQVAERLAAVVVNLDYWYLRDWAALAPRCQQTLL